MCETITCSPVGTVIDRCLNGPARTTPARGVLDPNQNHQPQGQRVPDQLGKTNGCDQAKAVLCSSPNRVPDHEHNSFGQSSNSILEQQQCRAVSSSKQSFIDRTMEHSLAHFDNPSKPNDFGNGESILEGPGPDITFIPEPNQSTPA